MVVPIPFGWNWQEYGSKATRTTPFKSYREHIRHVLKHADKRNYEEAVKYLGMIKKLLTQMGKAQNFPAIVAEVRTNHRRKRNLMTLLDRKKW